MENQKCMVCSQGAKYRVGVDRVPLCGTHRNQLKRNAGFGILGYTEHLTRPQIRSVFGFLVVDDRSEKAKP